VAQLYFRTLGSLYVVSYDSQGYGGDYNGVHPCNVLARALCQFRGLCFVDIEYTIRRIEEHRKGSKLDRIQELLIYADDVTL
jgi:hypothetical protein